MPRVLVPQPVHEVGMNLLGQGAEVKVGSGVDKERLIEEIADCEGLLVRTARIPGEVIKSAKNLKVIAQHGVGVDHIDVKTATKEGVLVVNAPEANAESVAEHTITMLLALAKNLIRMNREVVQGNFNIRYQITNLEVKNKVLGIIGLGKIGIKVAKKANCLGLKTIAYDPYIEQERVSRYNIRLYDSIDEILKRANFVTIHVPLTDSTRGLIGEREFNLFNKDAYLINAARGPIVDEKALYQALQEGQIKGAALDVFQEEPPDPANKLFKLDNVVFSPHNAALTDQSLQNMATQAVNGILDFFSGKKPRYIVNPRVLN